MTKYCVGVSFCSTSSAAGRIEDLHDRMILKAANDDKEIHKGRFPQQEQFQIRELKIPNFCLLDFISLSPLDAEEDEFLGDLVGDIQNCSSILSRTGQK